MLIPLSLHPLRKAVSGQAWRAAKDRLAHAGFYGLAILPMILLAVMLGALIYRSYPILQTTSLWNLLTGRTGLPSKSQFGFLPFILGTVWVTVVALILSVPPSLLTAIFLAEYARPALRMVMKPMLDLLAAIPSVIYGVWGMLAIVPLVQRLALKISQLASSFPLLGIDNPTGYSILSGGIVLALMICPFIIAVSFEVLRTVPDGYRQASLAAGATHWETIKFAVLPKARSGMMAGIVLGVSRAIGETMAVLMVVGNVARVPSSIFDPAYPLPAMIANNYGEMLSIPHYDAALMTAALILLVAVVLINIATTMILRRITQNIAS